MFSKVLFGLEVMALIAAPIGYLMLREYRAEQFFKAGETALREGDWNQAYTCYQEAARRENKDLAKIVACRLTLCKDFGLGVAPAAQIENCPLHGDAFSDCLVASKVSAKLVFEAAKQRLADVGSTDLIIWVATTYLNGSSSQSRYNAVYTNNYLTVPQDYDEAAAWYRMAAVRGRVDAQRQLIYMAYNRQWTPSPEELPSEWLLNAKDSLSARILLGERIAAGDEALAKHPEASDWLLAAAQNDNTAAQARVAIKLAQGEDLPLSQETATRYLLSAAKQGDETAKQALIDRVTEMSSSDLQQFPLVLTWVEALAQQGDYVAQGCLGALLAKGQWDEGTPEEQVTYLRESADAGNADAQFTLGIRYKVGDGVERDRKVAAEWFQKAANQDHARAQYELSECYKMGWGVPQSRELAETWLYESAKNGNEDAKRELPLRLRYKLH